MKPKLNILKKQVEINQPVFPDIPAILTGEVDYDITVFDATALCEAENVKEPEYHLFHSACLRYITPMLASEGVKPAEIYYQNADKHTLIHASLLLVYLQFILPDTVVYFNGLLTSCLSEGIAFSDSYAMHLTASRVPNEVLARIIESRNNAAEE